MTSNTPSSATTIRLGLRHALAAGRMAAALACAGAAHCAHAADTLYAYDGFDYAVGSQLAGQSGGSGWAGAWASNADTAGARVVAGLQYTDAAGRALATSGGAIRANPLVYFAQETRDTLKQFGQAGDSIWVSFLVQQVADPDMGTSYAVAALGQGLTFGSHAMDGGVTGTTASVGSFYTAGGAQNANAAIAANSVSLIALRYDFASSGNDTISMWINPLLDAPLGAPDASGAFKNYASAFTGVTLAYGDYKPFVYDELRIGSSFSAVTAVTAVPEPQSFALLLAGLGAIALLRRRLG